MDKYKVDDMTEHLMRNCKKLQLARMLAWYMVQPNENVKIAKEMRKNGQ
tara:strand:- start:511 stop:657 length:147 start_codon:yes stop_codon:yes gene_type:complete